MTSNKYVLQSIRHQGFVSLIFFFLVFIVSVSVFGTALFTENIELGVRQSGNRVGADIMVVPTDYGESANEVLFKGNSCTVLLKDNITDGLKKLDGISNASPQLYLQTLPMKCCASAKMQIIAIDPATDFTVSEWMGNDIVRKLGRDEIIAGSAGGVGVGEKVRLFGRELRVVGVMDETGMGYDQSVFLSYQTADLITARKEYADIFGERTDLASTVLVNIRGDAEKERVRREISDIYASEGISAYTVSDIVDGLSKQAGYFKSFGEILNAIVAVIGAVALFSLVTITFHQRRNRVGSLLSVGISKGRIAGIFFREYIYLMLSATAAGIIFVCIFLLPLHNIIKQQLDMPYKFIDIYNAAGLALLTAGVNLVILLAAVSMTFFKLIRLEPAMLAEEQI